MRYTSLGTHGFRGYQVLILRLQPVRWVPNSGKLYWCENLTVTVQLGAGTASPLYRSLSEDETAVSARVDNEEDTWAQTTVIGSYPATQARGAGTYQLLVLTTSGEMAVAFEDLQAAHGTTTPTEIVTMSGTVTWQAIRDRISSAYTSDKIDFVLIGGDDDMLPAPKLRAEYQFGESGESKDIPSDFYLGCLGGAQYNPENPYDPALDLVAEVYVGRCAADNPAEVTCFVNKTVQYIDTQHAYVDRVLSVGEALGFPELMYGTESMEQLIDGSSAEGYTTVGIPSNSYTIGRLCDADGYTWPPSKLIGRMNGGVHWINHMGHGWPDNTLRMRADFYPATAPSCSPGGGGSYVRVNDMQALTNSALFFVYTQACDPGHFDGLDCVAEYFTAKAEHGAFAVIMNARAGLGGVTTPPQGPSERFHRYFWQRVFETDLERRCYYYGDANQRSKEDLIPLIEDEGTRWCFYQLNLFGDPSLLIQRVQSP